MPVPALEQLQEQHMLFPENGDTLETRGTISSPSEDDTFFCRIFFILAQIAKYWPKICLLGVILPEQSSYKPCIDAIFQAFKAVPAHLQHVFSIFILSLLFKPVSVKNQ